MDLQTVVLCAGKGTRMNTEKAKVMHEIMGRPMLEYIYNICTKITDEKPIFVVGHKKEQIMDYFGEKAIYVSQDEQLGTGHAIKLTQDKLKEGMHVLIMCGDTPLLSQSTVKQLIDALDDDTDAMIVSSFLDEPFGYGRIVKDENGDFVKIVEQKDATHEEALVKEVNSGIYIIKSELIKKFVGGIDTDNAQGEYYLTDIFKKLKENGYAIKTFRIKSSEILGVNNRVQLEKVRCTMQRSINRRLMEQGVTMINPDSIYIHDTVEIGKDTVIYPNNYITGQTKIGEGCVLYSDNEIQDSIIKDDVKIRKSFIEKSTVEESVSIGPYAHLRPNAYICEKAHIGNFVEIKNANIGQGSKAAHLSYVGDADVGKDVNIGCGVIFVNYDGKHKQRSVVKDSAFIGSNSNLIAPVTVGEKGYVATGSTVTDDVPAKSLCIARSRQVIKADWTKKSKLLDK